VTKKQVLGSYDIDHNDTEQRACIVKPFTAVIVAVLK
jgi:hypothetical protein